MPRKKDYVKQIDYKDKLVLKTLYCCQHMKGTDITQIVTKHRLESYLKQGIVQKEYRLSKRIRTKSKEVYSLTEKGRKWINKNIYETRQTLSYQSGTAVDHNIQLSEIYLQSMCKENSQWLTERDLQQLFLDSIRDSENYQQLIDEYRQHQISAPDAGILHENGEIELIEITTTSYTPCQITAKEKYSEYMSMPIQFIRI